MVRLLAEGLRLVCGYLERLLHFVRFCGKIVVLAKKLHNLLTKVIFGVILKIVKTE
jgi:hypothetical protein